MGSVVGPFEVYNYDCLGSIPVISGVCDDWDILGSNP